MRELSNCGLLREGVTAEDLQGAFTVVMAKKGILGGFWEKIRGIKKDEKAFVVVADPSSLKEILEKAS